MVEVQGRDDLVTVVQSQIRLGPDVLDRAAQIPVAGGVDFVEQVERCLGVLNKPVGNFGRCSPGEGFRFAADLAIGDIIGNRNIVGAGMRRQGNKAVDIVETGWGAGGSGNALASFDIPLEVKGAPVEPGGQRIVIKS